MSFSPPNFQSSTSRPLAIRKRADLEIRPHSSLGRQAWIVKDPLGLKYYRLQEQELAILDALDGRRSLDDIRRLYVERFPPARITTEELHSFIASLYAQGLVVADEPGQGQSLLNRYQTQRRRRFWSALANPLAIRWRGVDPQRFLAWLCPRVRWLFAPWFLAAAVLLGLSAVGLVVVNFETFESRLPSFHEFFQARNLVWMAVTLAGVKILHELGHGLVCEHFGGRCHELGMMLLLFIPCLYCNVSDAWILPGRWPRIAVAAAGMYVELLLAAVATWVWWFVEPGLVSNLCLGVMLIGSVNTLILNGNPLLRYDGYFILSHALELPNLMEKSNGLLTAQVRRLVLGLEPVENRFWPERGRRWLVAYAILSFIYRAGLLVAVSWMLYDFFESRDLKVIGQAFAIAAVVGFVFAPLARFVGMLRVPGQFDRVPRRRPAIVAGALLLVAMAVAFIPLPNHVPVPLVLAPRDAARVYVTTPGLLDVVEVKPGSRVRQGDTLAKLTNPDVADELVKLRGQVAESRLLLRTLERQRVTEPSAAAQIPAARETLDDLEKRLVRLEDEQRRLTLRSPVDGEILPPPPVVSRATSDGKLPRWSDTPLEAENHGCFLEHQTLFCLVGDARRLEGVLVIDQSQVEYLHQGDPVDVKLDELPGRTFSGTLGEIAQLDVEAVPEQLSHKWGGDLTTRRDEQGRERPASTSYQARVAIDDESGLLILGATGRAKVFARSQTLGERLWRSVRGTLHWP